MGLPQKGLTARKGEPEKDSQNGTDRISLPWQDFQDRSQDRIFFCQDRAARIRMTAQDCKDKTTKVEPKGEDSQKKTGTSQLEQD